MGVKWETEKPSEFLDRKKRELHSIVIPNMGKALAREVQDRIRQFTPIGFVWKPPAAEFATRIPSGHLQRSISMEPKGVWTVFKTFIWGVSTDVDYAPYVEYGTRPHLIRAKGSGYLAFHVAPSGAKVEARVVHHPGTRPVYMFTKGTAAAEARSYSIMQKYILPWEKDDRGALRILERAL